MTNCPMCTKWADDVDLQIAEFDHTYIILNRDQFFPGYCFVFTKAHVTELFHLEQSHRATIMEEVSTVAQALYSVFQPTKINYELLGNMVPHMHWHVVPRFATEPLWPRPIWCEPHEPIILAAKECTQRIGLIQHYLRSP